MKQLRELGLTQGRGPLPVFHAYASVVETQFPMVTEVS